MNLSVLAVVVIGCQVLSVPREVTDDVAVPLPFLRSLSMPAEQEEGDGRDVVGALSESSFAFSDFGSFRWNESSPQMAVVHQRCMLGQLVVSACHKAEHRIE